MLEFIYAKENRYYRELTDLIGKRCLLEEITALEYNSYKSR